MWAQANQSIAGLTPTSQQARGEISPASLGVSIVSMASHVSHRWLSRSGIPLQMRSYPNCSRCWVDNDHQCWRSNPRSAACKSVSLPLRYSGESVSPTPSKGILNSLRERNVNHITTSCCHLPVSSRPVWLPWELKTTYLIFY